jgi:Sec-independent protein translocase protein TatA
MFGASPNELALVVLLVLVVLAAPKVPRLGERIGAFFDKKPR